MKKLFYELVSKVLLKKHIHLIRGLNYLGRPTIIPLTKIDFVRVGTLELIATEILENNIDGNLAELGVYKGGFSKYINRFFPDRTLFLFDTFEGFAHSDMVREKSIGLKASAQDFSDTSAQEVMKRMPFPEKCVIKKGFFPETFSGLEQTPFCFASIDADLYEPISQGLELFYNNLSPGGYVMVHDYNNKNYQGCKKAVNEFCVKYSVSFVPIPDIGGSIVIHKPRTA